LGSNEAVSNGGIFRALSRSRKEESPMFARILEIAPKLEKKDELIKTVRQEILPILKEQPGFLELLPFVPENVNEKYIAITLWSEKHVAEKYVKEVFPKVEQILKPFLTAPVMFRMYTVETTLCQHLVEALTATV
jgi:quinol monooxygenase YgiN